MLFPIFKPKMEFLNKQNKCSNTCTLGYIHPHLPEGALEMNLIEPDYRPDHPKEYHVGRFKEPTGLMADGWPTAGSHEAPFPKKSLIN